jgi:MFS family permease
MMFCWLLLTFSASPAVLFAAASLAGVALGCALPTTAGLVANSFGSARFGQVWGWAYALTGSLLLSCVIFAGAMFDKTGSYHVPFMVFAILLAAVSLLTMLVSPTTAKS